MTPPTSTATNTSQYVPRSSDRGLYSRSEGNFKDKDGVLEVTGESDHKYPNYLPVWDGSLKYSPLTEFEHKDPGLRADSNLPNLLKDGVEARDLTPKFGSEVKGVQLSSLDDKGKDELALYVAQRGVVAFRDQDFADLDIKDAVEYGKHFGRLHIHPTTGAPKGYPEIHLVHRSATVEKPEVLNRRTTSTVWHSDVTYEKQPPGTTFLYLLEGPKSGGDTAFVDTVESYERLSDEFKKRLSGLKAIHSGFEQYQNGKDQGRYLRRDPVANEHPVVRTHPVTKKKALFVNEAFTREIVGFKREESEALLKFLYDHNAKGTDFQTRVKWEPGTVVVWDNRRALHAALYDWEDQQRRHLARITPQAEIPYEE